MTSAGPAMKPPQEASDFENVPIRRSTRSSTPSSSRGARAARAEHAGAVRLVDHQPRAVALAEVADLRQRRDVALHREDAVDDDEDAAAVARRALERLLELVEAVVAERRAAWRARAGSRRGSRRGRRSRRRRCRPAPRIVPSAPRLAWWPVVKTIASSVPIHSASSRSSSRCRSIVPLSRREPVRPVP